MVRSAVSCADKFGSRDLKHGRFYATTATVDPAKHVQDENDDGVRPARVQPNSMTNPFASVLLEACHLPDEKVLIEALRSQHPGLLWESSVAAASIEADDCLLIRAGDDLVVILLIPQPMPFNQQLWQQASLLWEEAFEAMGRHRAHLVVSILTSAVGGTEAPKRSVIESSRLITAIVGGLIKAHQGCLAVAWNGKVGRSPAEWLSQAPRSFEPYPDHPYSLWIEIVHFVSGPTIGAYTTGLSAFVGREIEFEVDGLDQRGVLYRVASASSYLIANGLDAASKSGLVYRDEDPNVGAVAIIHRNSRFNLGPVISFFSIQDQAGRLKTYPVIPIAIARNHPLLVMLGKVGLFDAEKTENLIELRPDHYASETRLETYDDALTYALSRMIATDAYAKADANARRALDRGDIESAKSVLVPWAEEVAQLRQALKLALLMCDALMFMPAPLRHP